MKRILMGWLVLVLAGCGGKSAQDWVEQLKDKDAAQRLRAVKALGASRSETALVVPALADVLKDENAYVRRDAAEALGKIGPEAREAVPALAAALKDRNRAVRKAAAGALKKVDPQAAAQAGVK
jgi:HEAT repeat protein